MCAYIVLGTFLLPCFGQGIFYFLTFLQRCEDDRAGAVSCSVICAKPNLGAPMPQKLLGDSQRIIPQKFFSTDLIVSPSIKVITHPCSRRTHIFNYGTPPPSALNTYSASCLPPCPGCHAFSEHNTLLHLHPLSCSSRALLPPVPPHPTLLLLHSNPSFFPSHPHNISLQVLPSPFSSLLIQFTSLVPFVKSPIHLQKENKKNSTSSAWGKRDDLRVFSRLCFLHLHHYVVCLL